MSSESPSANAFHYPAYVKYFTSRITHSFALQILSTAIGWQVYAITHNPIYLAYIGLAVFLPVLFLVIPAGLVADHFNRRFVSAAVLGWKPWRLWGSSSSPWVIIQPSGRFYLSDAAWRGLGVWQSGILGLGAQCAFQKKRCRTAFH